MTVKIRLLFVFLLLISSSIAQNRIPPVCFANQNDGAGGVIGHGKYLGSFDGSSINFSFTIPTLILNVEFNDVLVLYIANGSPGRSSIDSSVDDSADAYRIAVTNSNVNGFGSNINFPSGFEITHAIAIDPNVANLYAIPASGDVGDGGLNFLSAVSSTLTSNTQGHFDLNFEPSDIGITDASFGVVGVYVGHDGYTYDEGWGEGIIPGTQGSDDITFTAAPNGPVCFKLLGVDEFQNNVEAYYLDDHLHLNGVSGNINISVFDLLGKKTYSQEHAIQGRFSLPMHLKKNVFQFIVIESSNKRKILKIIPISH